MVGDNAAVVDQQGALAKISRAEIRIIRDRTIPAIIFLSKAFGLRTPGTSTGWYYNQRSKEGSEAAEMARKAWTGAQPTGPEASNLYRLTRRLREGACQEGELRVHFSGIYEREKGGAWGVWAKWWENENRTARLWQDFGSTQAKDTYEAQARAAAKAADVAAQILFGIQDSRWIQHYIRATT